MARRTIAAPLVALVVLLVVAACPRPSRSAVVDPARATAFVRGVGLGLFATDPEYDYTAMLDEIVAHGATDLLVAVVWYQTDLRSHDIAPRPGSSPSDENVLRTLKAAKARGLRVGLLPIVRLVHHTRTEWRGRIDPAAGPEVWFSSYGRFLGRMAELAAKAGIERLSVGSELLSLEKHEAHWRALIAEVRTRFPGKLLYSANWDHYQPIRFWDALDEIGVTAYFELTRREDRAPTDEELAQAWAWPRTELLRLKLSSGKPVIVTEVGYPSRSTAGRYPWDETRKAPLDHQLQARLYDAFCAAFLGRGAIDGFYVWNWFGFGGAEDSTYTPRGKPAARSMDRCLRDARWDAVPARPNF